MRIPVQKILNDPFVKNLIDQDNYAEAAKYLFHTQLSNWEMLSKNYETLKNIQTKSFWYDGFKMNVQFNPERIKSTAAEVDEKSVANRDCFLCVNNIPEEQKGIILLDKFLLLCNPYPIFPQHFTINSLLHQPQRIKEYFDDILRLAKQLAPGYTIIYNGPACGASAPDHFHFQAGTKFFMPIEDDIQQLANEYGIVINENDKMRMSFIDDGIRRMVFVESDDNSEINNIFTKVLSLYENLASNAVEPMMNILCSYEMEVGWNVIIFLREKHRPDYFFRKDPEKLLVSPAAIDLGGILITPRESDFKRMNKGLTREILNEVSLNPKTFASLAENFKKMFF
jgi:galactose-1-phosphate uridylyltransferase